MEEDHKRFVEIDKKRKADHSAFDSYVKSSDVKLADLQSKYNDLLGRYTKIQKAYATLEEEHTDAQIKLNGNAFENARLQTLLDIKYQEIADLKDTLTLYVPHSPPNIDSFVSIMTDSKLDSKVSADNSVVECPDFYDFTHDESPFINLDEEDRDASGFPSDQLAQPRTYAKKQNKLVTNPAVLHALRLMARNVYSYSRKPFQGVNINGVRYAFYFGKINTGSTIGLVNNIVLSNEKKVYNIADIGAPIEMNWQQDPTNTGKRGYGTIYLGNLTGGKGFETKLQDVFKTELGVIL